MHELKIYENAQTILGSSQAKFHKKKKINILTKHEQQEDPEIENPTQVLS